MYDRVFFDKIIMNKSIQKILDKLFEPTNSYYILNQQNAVINDGSSKNIISQSWHRDFPYLNGILSIPSAYSIIFAFDDFSENGGTRLILYTIILKLFQAGIILKKT